MTAAPEPVRRNRLEVVDAVRGLAVLFMVEWHTADAWVREPERTGQAFHVAEILGGLAAPFFFLLAGMSLGLSERTPATRASTLAGARRGLGILVAGYGLRTYAVAVDRGGLAELSRAPGIVAFSLGLLGLYVALGDRLRATALRWGLGALGLGLVVMGVFGMTTTDAANALRLDVLHGIGVALVVVVLVLASSSPLDARARVVVMLVLAVSIALVAPHVLSMRAPPGPMRVWDYVARFDVSPSASGARFPIVPWLGYTFVGASLGRVVRGRLVEGGAFGLPFSISPWLLFVVFVIVVALAFEGGPVATALLPHVEWLRGVDRQLFYTSAALASAGVVAGLARQHGALPSALALLGRHSLVIYAVHLEIAYGLPGTLVRRSLGWVAWSFLALLLLSAMGVLAVVIERAEAKRPSNHGRNAPSPG